MRGNEWKFLTGWSNKGKATKKGKVNVKSYRKKARKERKVWGGDDASANSSPADQTLSINLTSSGHRPDDEICVFYILSPKFELRIFLQIMSWYWWQSYVAGDWSNWKYSINMSTAGQSGGDLVTVSWCIGVTLKIYFKKLCFGQNSVPSYCRTTDHWQT